MAITDNSFDEQELISAIEANPKLVETLRTGLASKKYQFGTEEELETQYTSKHVSKFAPELEKTVKDVTGLDKADVNEKYYDYNKRALSTIVQERAAAQKELSDLKKTSNLSDYERQQLEELKTLVKTKDIEITTIKDGAAKEISKATLRNGIIQEASTVQGKLLNNEIPGFLKARKMISDAVINEIGEITELDKGGNMILVVAGKALTNKDGSFKTVAQRYEERMNEEGMVDSGKVQTGAGGSGKDNLDVKNIPGNATTQAELMDWLRDNTMKGKSQVELMKEFDKYLPLLSK